MEMKNEKGQMKNNFSSFLFAFSFLTKNGVFEEDFEADEDEDYASKQFGFRFVFATKNIANFKTSN